MNVLVVGGGGREHAICWALARQRPTLDLYCCPGNPGIADVALCVPIAATDLCGLMRFARETKIDFVIVGPEQPLVLGLVDALEGAGIATFGPTQQAAILEGSKAFCKDFCTRHNIPTAPYKRFSDSQAARAWIDERYTAAAPPVIKADGLAGGKGAIVARTLDEAKQAVVALLDDRRFGEASSEIIVEDRLAGTEISFFAISDGEHVIALDTAQDHKRAFDGDQGPNTGGMGAYSPAALHQATRDLIMETIIQPTVQGMRAEGRRFKGVLYAGVMLTDTGPQLIEYNVRFGDPETQVLLPRLESDLLALLINARNGYLAGHYLDWSTKSAITIVYAANGYPDAPILGTEISIDQVVIRNSTNTGSGWLFHAGTKQEGGRLLASGGRALAVTAMAHTLAAARAQAYEVIERIVWPGGFFRTDIGKTRQIDWRGCPRVESVPDRLAGTPVLVGTRMPAQTIVDKFEAGMTPAAIANEWGLSLTDVQIILDYCTSLSLRFGAT